MAELKTNKPTFLLRQHTIKNKLPTHIVEPVRSQNPVTEVELSPLRHIDRAVSNQMKLQLKLKRQQ
jgi:hypothetical protein